jgi:hypothetical protein
MNKRKTRNLIKIIYIMIAILALVALVLLINELLPNGTIKNPWKVPEKYPIKDECALILNRLIHQIKDEADCHIRCRNECTVREKDISSSEFIAQDQDCNICNCYCK